MARTVGWFTCRGCLHRCHAACILTGQHKVVPVQDPPAPAKSWGFNQATPQQAQQQLHVPAAQPPQTEATSRVGCVSPVGGGKMQQLAVQDLSDNNFKDLVAYFPERNGLSTVPFIDWDSQLGDYLITTDHNKDQRRRQREQVVASTQQAPPTAPSTTRKQRKRDRRRECQHCGGSFTELGNGRSDHWMVRHAGCMCP